jgi:hypothetical protein
MHPQDTVMDLVGFSIYVFFYQVSDNKVRVSQLHYGLRLKEKVD